MGDSVCMGHVVEASPVALGVCIGGRPEEGRDPGAAQTGVAGRSRRRRRGPLGAVGGRGEGH